MKRNQIFILLGCLVGGVGLLFGLYAFSPLTKELYRGSFDRKFIQYSDIEQKAVMDIEYNSFYIAGQTDDTIYLGNSTAPFHLLITNRTLTDSQHVMLKVHLDSILDVGKFSLKVEPPYFYLSHGVMPKQLRGKVGEWEAKDILGDRVSYFDEAVPLGGRSFALRAYSNSQKSSELGKIASSKPFEFHYDLLNKQVDGIFCLDGRLLYNSNTGRLAYVHHYRNEFILADSNLNLLYRGHTIDTFSRARVKVANIGETGQSMMAAPPPQVNGMSCISEKYLLVQSRVMANNEIMQEFLSTTVVDVYDLETGQYLKSFYIQSYKSERPLSFSLIKNHLAVIFDHYLVMYDIDLETQDLSQ
jgi:hypothetical protein